MGRSLTSEEKSARRAERLANSRWYISFSIKDSFGKYGAKDAHGRACYVRGAWPILFKSPEAAWTFARENGTFKNSEAAPGRGRIVSYSLERIKLDRRGP